MNLIENSFLMVSRSTLIDRSPRSDTRAARNARDRRSVRKSCAVEQRPKFRQFVPGNSSKAKRLRVLVAPPV
jgi:hypothetical protein